MRSRMKSVVMWMYCHRIMPAGVVTWLFRRFNLRAE